MAYFSNGSEGNVFVEQCMRCKYGQDCCPIAWVQTEYNYNAVGNEVATAILNELVANDGTCEMFKTFKGDFSIEDPIAEDLISIDDVF